MKYTIHISLLAMVLLSSCFKKEDPLFLPIGTSNITTLSMGPEYKKEVYFDLSTNSYQEKILADWDIRFQSGDKDFGIFLNNGTNIIAFKIDVFNLDEFSSYDTTTILKNKEMYDAPEGYVNKAALGGWKSYKNFNQKSGIYVIKLNYNSGFEKFKRIQIVNVDDTSYSLIITDLFLNNDKNKPIITGDTIHLLKDKTTNYTYYSFRTGGTGAIVRNVEPPKENWDFVITRYKHIFYGILPGNEPFPYILTGLACSKVRRQINMKILRPDYFFYFPACLSGLFNDLVA